MLSRQPARSGLVIYIGGSILGASVYALPFQVSRIGLIPMTALLIGVALLSTRLYPRVVASANALPGRSGEMTNVALGDPLAHAGAGATGRVFGLMTATFLVIPGSTGLALIGIGAMGRVTDALERTPNPAVAALLVAIASFATATMSNAFGSAAPALHLLTRWMLGSAGISAFGLTGTARTVGLAATFAVGAWSLIGSQQEENADDYTAFGLAPRHGRNASTILVLLAAMASLAALTVGLALGRDGLALPELVVRPTGPDDIVTSVGMVLFAFTATGLFNVGGYSAMRDSTFMRKTINASIAMVVVVQLVWIAAVSTSVSASSLRALDNAGADTTAAISESAAEAMAGFGVFVGALAALLVLFAVSAGANSHAELLSNEWYDSGRRILSRPQSEALEQRVRLRFGLVVLAATAAVVSVTLAIPTTTILGSAGLLGSTALAVTLPLLAERRSRWIHAACVGAILTIAAASIASIVGPVSAGAAPWVIAGVGMIAGGAIVIVSATAARLQQSGDDNIAWP